MRPGWIFLLWLTIPVGGLHAEVALHQLAGARMMLYAPDRIWQGHHVNLLLTVETGREAPERLEAALTLPGGQPPPFLYEGPLSQHLRLYPNEKKTLVFAGLLANPKAELSTHEIKVALEVGGRRVDSPIVLQVVPGARLSEGPGTLYLLAGLCALWSLLVAAFLGHRAGPRAWRTVGPEFKKKPPGALIPPAAPPS